MSDDTWLPPRPWAVRIAEERDRFGRVVRYRIEPGYIGFTCVTFPVAYSLWKTVTMAERVRSGPRPLVVLP